MKITVLFAQRKCAYPGQYAAEALEIADQFTMEDNPSWMTDKVKEYEKSNEFESLALVEIIISGDEIYKRLSPDNPPLLGVINKITGHEF